MPLFRTTRFFGLLFLFSLSVAISIFGVEGKRTRTSEDLTNGKKLMSEERFVEAIDLFERFKQTHPRDSRPYFYLGMALSQMGRITAAASELSEAIRLEPTKPEYHLFYADVLIRLGHKNVASEALTIFKTTQVVNQLTTAWLWLLSDNYYRLEQIEDTLRVLEILSKRDPKDPRNDLNRGQAYVAIANHELARRSFEQSIEKDPVHNALAYFELGKILHQTGEFGLAKKALLEAVRQDGTNAEYLHKLAVVCLALNEVDEAIGYLERAKPAAAKIPEIYYNLGKAYQKKGDRAKAEDYLKKFQEFTSTQKSKKDQSREAGILIATGEKQLDQGNKAEARTLFEKALQLEPDNWDAHGYLAEMFLASGDMEEARQHLAKIEEFDPDSVVGNYLMATYWYRFKDFDQALRYAVRAKSIQPGNSELRNLLGNIYLELGRQKEALDEYEAAARLAPDRSDYRQNLEAIRNRIRTTNSESNNR